MVTFQQARQQIFEQLSNTNRVTPTVELRLCEARSFGLAQDIVADRDYPPYDRATRDGYAVRAADASTGAALPCVGEIKAGDDHLRAVAGKTCWQIMTGAPVPPDADAVVMVEFTRREGDAIR